MKKKMSEYFDRYDQVAIVDSDIHINPMLRHFIDLAAEYDFGGVVERDLTH